MCIPPISTKTGSNGLDSNIVKLVLIIVKLVFKIYGYNEISMLKCCLMFAPFLIRRPIQHLKPNSFAV